jgi:CRISPR/Cas system-associated exonuclease Cas4 (RecB family)
MELPAPIYYCQEPKKWPEPPSLMSFTTLIEIEKCPRCWALVNAKYPNIWAKKGYPNRPTVYTIKGLTIHRVIEAIIKDLIVMKCRSINDSCFVQILKKHGGWSTVLAKVLNDVLLEEKHNPRLSGQYNSLRTKIRSQIPMMREATQNILRRVDLTNRVKGTYERQTGGALGLGSYTEVDLECREIGFCGRVDLITLKEGYCLITDFKTGEYKDQHELQVRVYALLWALDECRNPLRRLADRLCLSYKTKNIHIHGPSEYDLNELKSQLQDRVSRAKSEITSDKPIAKLSLENCKYCFVRHLCDEYWTEQAQRYHCGEGAGDKFVDVEVVLENRHASNIWKAILCTELPLLDSERVLVRTDYHLDLFEYCYETKQKIRMLGCRMMSINNEQETTNSLDYLHNPNEVFAVPSQVDGD